MPAMARCGPCRLPEGYVVTGDFEFGGGFSAMQTAAGACRSVRRRCLSVTMRWRLALIRRYIRRGLQVPQDMALVGYDDIELARYMTPPLTTIHQPKDELGELAIDVLIHRMAASARKNSSAFSLTPELVVRGSA